MAQLGELLLQGFHPAPDRRNGGEQIGNRRVLGRCAAGDLRVQLPVEVDRLADRRLPGRIEMAVGLEHRKRRGQKRQGFVPQIPRMFDDFLARRDFGVELGGAPEPGIGFMSRREAGREEGDFTQVTLPCGRIEPGTE